MASRQPLRDLYTNAQPTRPETSRPDIFGDRQLAAQVIREVAGWIDTEIEDLFYDGALPYEMALSLQYMTPMLWSRAALLTREPRRMQPILDFDNRQGMIRAIRDVYRFLDGQEVVLPLNDGIMMQRMLVDDLVYFADQLQLDLELTEGSVPTVRVTADAGSSSAPIAESSAAAASGANRDKGKRSVSFQDVGSDRGTANDSDVGRPGQQGRAGSSLRPSLNPRQASNARSGSRQWDLPQRTPSRPDLRERRMPSNYRMPSAHHVPSVQRMRSFQRLPSVQRMQSFQQVSSIQRVPSVQRMQSAQRMPSMAEFHAMREAMRSERAAAHAAREQQREVRRSERDAAHAAREQQRETRHSQRAAARDDAEETRTVAALQRTIERLQAQIGISTAGSRAMADSDSDSDEASAPRTGAGPSSARAERASPVPPTDSVTVTGTAADATPGAPTPQPQVLTEGREDDANEATTDAPGQ